MNDDYTLFDDIGLQMAPFAPRAWRDDLQKRIAAAWRDWEAEYEGWRREQESLKGYSDDEKARI